MNPQKDYQIPQPSNNPQIPEDNLSSNQPPQVIYPNDISDPASTLIRDQLQDLYSHQTPEAPTKANYNPYRNAEPQEQPASSTTQPANNDYKKQQQSVYSQPTATVAATIDPSTKAVSGTIDVPERSVAEIKEQLLRNVRGDNNSKINRWKPLIVALVVGFTFLLISYNEIAVAQIRQYISPGSSLSTPVILDPTVDVVVGPDPKIVIPKINVDVPVVYDVVTYEESAIQAGLERGVVHYGTTAVPGQIGNNVIVGHSSNNFFNSGKYKFAFVLLDRLEVGDTFILHYKGERYIYKVFNKQVIEPTDFSLIQPTDKPVTTLITCTPPGTSWRRLVVQAEQISPDPAGAKQMETDVIDDVNTVVPGNAPSFWQNIWDFF